MSAVLGQHKMTVVVSNGDPKDDTPLPAYHYDDTMDNHSEFTKQCWIPARPGSKFCIRYGWNGKAKPVKNAVLTCNLYVDELHIGKEFLLHEGTNNHSGENREWKIMGVFYNSPAGQTERPFMFKETSIDDDVDIIDTSNKGTIRVLLHWEEPNFNWENLYHGPPTQSDEKMDKAILGLETPVSSGDGRFRSCVSFGDPVKIGQVDAKYKPIDDKKYTFIFHYAHPGETIQPRQYITSTKELDSEPDWLEGERIIPPK
ncbi:hypothetical protein FRC11_011289, partial [Ceratobasidium sp. 423]